MIIHYTPIKKETNKNKELLHQDKIVIVSQENNLEFGNLRPQGDTGHNECVINHMWALRLPIFSA